MELRNLAHQMGDWESVDAFEFRMRETYGELLPRYVVRGLINLVPHLLALCALYYLLPIVELPGGIRVSTVSAYIAFGVCFLVFHHYRGWRRRSAPEAADHTGARDFGETCPGQPDKQGRTYGE
ncbi:hypothetical protein [Rubrobacter radiotolerans]|nr:hypothetical protein [Rubrobacter radiotolerans]MDX5894712.1 hypothetical protein [Rubrobacter radiotolerans]